MERIECEERDAKILVDIPDSASRRVRGFDADLTATCREKLRGNVHATAPCNDQVRSSADSDSAKDDAKLRFNGNGHNGSNRGRDRSNRSYAGVGGRR